MCSEKFCSFMHCTCNKVAFTYENCVGTLFKGPWPGFIANFDFRLEVLRHCLGNILLDKFLQTTSLLKELKQIELHFAMLLLLCLSCGAVVFRRLAPLSAGSRGRPDNATKTGMVVPCGGDTDKKHVQKRNCSCALTNDFFFSADTGNQSLGTYIFFCFWCMRHLFIRP